MLSSISAKLGRQIQDTQKLIVQEQKSADTQKNASSQSPVSITMTQSSDGHKNVTVIAIESLNIGTSLSGEIVRTYLQRIVDLTVAKDAYDLCKGYLNTTLEAEVLFIGGLCVFWSLKELLSRVAFGRCSK